MTWWRWTLAGLIVLGAGALAVAALRERPPPRTEVQLARVRRGDIARVVVGAGKVRPATTVKISSNLSGDLVELKVKEGDGVTVGQVLGRIDRRRFEASVRQAQAALNAAKGDMATAQVEADQLRRELERTVGLAAKALVAAADVDRATANADGARARVAALNERVGQAAAVLDEANSNLAKTVLLSPIAGTVINLAREVGERVRGSDFSEDVVMTLAGLAAMEVNIEVSEHEVVHLKPGQRAEVSIDALEGQRFGGAVTEIAQQALVRNAGTEQETTSFPVTVALDGRPPRAMPGMNAEVRILAERRGGVLVVPVQAVTARPERLVAAAIGVAPPGGVSPGPGSLGTSTSGGAGVLARADAGTGTGALTDGGADEALFAPRSDAYAKVVFVVEDGGRARLRRVVTGIASDTDIEVREGLREGEHIVEGPYRTLAKELADGTLVEDVSDAPGADAGTGTELRAAGPSASGRASPDGG